MAVPLWLVDLVRSILHVTRNNNTTLGLALKQLVVPMLPEACGHVLWPSGDVTVYALDKLIEFPAQYDLVVKPLGYFAFTESIRE